MRLIFCIFVRRTLLTVFAELAMGKIDGKTLNPFFSKSAGQISFVGSVVEKRTINRFLAVPSLNFAYFLRIRRKRVELAIFVGFALANSFYCLQQGSCEEAVASNDTFSNHCRLSANHCYRLLSPLTTLLIRNSRGK